MNMLVYFANNFYNVCMSLESKAYNCRMIFYTIISKQPLQ